MPQAPSEKLVDLLTRFRLATPDQLRRARACAGRLARQLPELDCVWVDALVQVRALTPFQAAEIHAGRGENLALGPLVLCNRLPLAGLGQWYAARLRETGQQVRVLWASAPERTPDELEHDVQQLIQTSSRITSEGILPALCGEVAGDRRSVWAACLSVPGTTASERMVRCGRFPPAIVLEIARAMLAALAALHEAGQTHGDVGAQSLILGADGSCWLALPGVRGVVRPQEGYALADLPPEAYDALAPERIIAGVAPSPPADIYSAGCLWWHLLAGRGPLAGGDSLARMRSSHRGRIPEILRLAPHTPEPLARAIAWCLHADPAQRPASPRQLLSFLGPPTSEGQRRLARWLAERDPATGWSEPRSARRRFPRAGSSRPFRDREPSNSLLATTVAFSLLALVGIGWPVWKNLHSASQTNAPAVTAAPGAKESQTPAIPPPHLPAPAVLPASFTEAAPPSYLPDEIPPTKDDLLLPAGEPVDAATLQLKPGQTVRAAPGRRGIVAVNDRPLQVKADGMRFVNVDFRCSSVPAAAGSEPCLVELAAAGTEFRGCTFSAPAGLSPGVAAIRWASIAGGDDERQLPTGQLRLVDCVLRDVSAGVSVHGRGAILLDGANVLHLGPGPLVKLQHAPRLDEPIVLALAHATLRDARALVELRTGQAEREPGRITIRAAQSVFVPRDGGPLVLCLGETEPAALLRAFEWTGQGSLVGTETPVAVWQPGDASPVVLDESLISITGLVRGDVEFAGPSSAAASASVANRWLAPLRSPQPPGIEGTRLR